MSANVVEASVMMAAVVVVAGMVVAVVVTVVGGRWWRVKEGDGEWRLKMKCGSGVL
ncbi:hypothetical protein Hanom_Chr01g00069481 [Helianthus anomalus]